MKSNTEGRVLPLWPRSVWQEAKVAAIISISYLVVSSLVIGFKTDQLILSIIYAALYVATPGTRKFIQGFSVFLVFWVLYDYMKAFPNYTFNPVHIQSLYDAEIYFFGIQQNGQWLTPNEYWNAHSVVWADVLAGAFYLCWIPVPLGFAAFMFFRDRGQFLQFLLTFLLVNLLGFVVYYLYPAAPPWYVQQYGFTFHASTPGNVAGLLRFDQFFNVTIFQSLYSKGSNVFAAMPSLHSAYPLIVTWFSFKNKLGWVTLVFATISLGIWLAAVYTSHHYVLDVLAGITTAATGIALFEELMHRSKPFKRFVDRYTELIS